MIVIANKTELKLREDLGNLVRQKPDQRCFFIELSKTEIPKNQLFETFLRLLEDVPNSYTAHIYLCQDKDILIIMKAFMQRQFMGFVKTLSVALEVEDLSDLVDVFEIGTDWNRLEQLYTNKIEALDRAQEDEEEQQRKESADRITLNVLSSLDPVLVLDINARREKRARPLVMVADDDQLARTLAGNVLRGDYDMAFAKNGEEALQEFVNLAPDVLFLDIGMPDINGHEVLENIFQMDPHAYIIMFSGRKDKGTIMRSLEMGAQGFLGKPFTREQLYNHVEHSPFIQHKQSAVA